MRPDQTSHLKNCKIIIFFNPPNLWSFYSSKRKLTHSSTFCCSSVQFSSVAQPCLTLLSHGLQHARPPCPSPTPGAYLNSCPLSRWCHPTISSSVVPASSCLQSFPASGSFQMSQFFTSGGQSFSFSISPSNEYSGLISFRRKKWMG